MQMADMETARLRIRGTKESDGAACLDIWLDEEMGRYMVDPPRDLADEDELNFAVGIETQGGWYPMVVFHKDTGDFLGTCSVVPKDEGTCWDFGYAVHKRFWRQGYGTEILTALIAAGKAQGVTVFTAAVAQENTASCALLRKLGFRVWKDDGSYRKRNTSIVYKEYIFRLDVSII